MIPKKKQKNSRKNRKWLLNRQKMVSRETLDGFKISFDAKYDDIFEGLEATDKADGTNLKARKLFLSLQYCF